MNRLGVSLVIFVLAVALAHGAPPTPGLRTKVVVGAETRLDWTFVVSNQSLTKIPEGWLGGYESSKQTFDIYLPTLKDPKQSVGLLLYIAPDNVAGGFSLLVDACKTLNIACVGVRECGNSVPSPKRVRVVLDVLDDIRRVVNVDPDRTYIAGFSGGGRMACAIGFALPELFGGIYCMCAAGELREEPYLRQRCIDRLSVIFLAGQTDFNRSEVERYRGPMLKDVGVRTLVKVVTGGHAVPDARMNAEMIRWLEEDLPRRRSLAKEFPASRFGKETPDRTAQAQSLFEEGRKRLEKPATLYTGLMQMKGCLERWPDTKAAKEAKEILLKYEARKEKPWEADDIAEQRRFLIARARGLSAYATGELPQQYVKQRGDMAKAAIELWKQVIADGADKKAVEEGKKRLPELEKILNRKK